MFFLRMLKLQLLDPTLSRTQVLPIQFLDTIILHGFIQLEPSYLHFF